MLPAKGDAMNVMRAVIGVCALALLGLVLWAAFAKQDLHGVFMDQVNVLLTLPWGIATLADLLVGFILFATLVFVVERSWIASVFWAAPVFVLGNMWAALWFIVRLPHLAKQLAQPR